MTTDIFACDVSRYQVPVSDEYKRRWLIFRIGDGSLDPTARANLAWCREALADGRLDGYTGYLVYRPGETPTHLLDEIGYPTDRHVMLDVESWGGQITGRRGRELNQIADQLAARQDDRSLVWGYGNVNDLKHLWPGSVSLHPRRRWLRLVVAAYSANRPSYYRRRQSGWQYSDGETKYPVPDGWPRSSAPFGHCDHNRLYLTDQDLGDDMTPDECRAVVRDEINRAIGRTTKGSDGKLHQISTLIRWGVDPVAKLSADADKRIAALQAEQAAQAAKLDQALAALDALKSAQPHVTGEFTINGSGKLGDSK